MLTSADKVSTYSQISRENHIILGIQGDDALDQSPPTLSCPYKTQVRECKSIAAQVSTGWKSSRSGSGKDALKQIGLKNTKQ